MNTLAFKILWRALLYPSLAFAALAFVFFWIYAHPRRYISPREPESLGLIPERVRLSTTDGISLDAWFIPHKISGKTVIICHGYPMDKGDVLELTHFLARDFNLLYFDFRATGRSGGFFSTGGKREVRDIDAAVAFLKSRGLAGGIGLFGFSMGAATVLLSENPAIKARAADAPYADLAQEMAHIFRGFGIWRKPLLAAMKAWSLVLMGVNINSISPARSAAGLTTPVLLIQGDADTQVPPENAFKIKAASPSAELWLIKGAGHGETREAAGLQYEERIAAFFAKNL
ncbi:MAG: hypothetical protein A2234_06830 [Elusimicrobia bacterium RIFOXYA2_FULL_58_8]|nr:MAG: hypothetical protein A2285_10025 [Elusimicrobia bacterium RIFOXYA12_FULL_57_11]OGS16675.1 MAG: hypothetical protein A2234_06830 [Elusimicrobia bacterium RIFOXYA2_FULL_58_8]